MMTRAAREVCARRAVRDHTASATGALALVLMLSVAARAAMFQDLPDGVPSGAELLRADRAAVDFGRIAVESTCEATVRLTNRSSRPVELGITDADCTCLSSRVSPTRLGPGDSAEWRIVLQTCDYVGEVRKQVWIRAADSGATLIRIPVRYCVVPEIYAVPDIVALGLIGDDLLETRFEVRSAGREPVRLLSASCDDSAIELELESADVTADRPGRVRVRVHGPMPEGPLQPTAWIDTSCAALPRLRVPLVGESVVGLTCEPNAVQFERVLLGRAATRTLTLAHVPEFGIGEIRSNTEAVDVVAVERTAGRVLITLRSAPRLPLGEFRGFLNIEVRGNGSRWMRFPICGDVVERAGDDHGASSAAPAK